MKDCATSTMRFETATNLALEAAFDGGRLTSDGGLLWLAKADAEKAFATVLCAGFGDPTAKEIGEEIRVIVTQMEAIGTEWGW